MNESTSLQETCEVVVVKKNGTVIVKRTKGEHNNGN